MSIDAIKMSLLGKASMFPGAMALILNLCVTVGENTDKFKAGKATEGQGSQTQALGLRPQPYKALKGLIRPLNAL